MHLSQSANRVRGSESAARFRHVSVFASRGECLKTSVARRLSGIMVRICEMQLKYGLIPWPVITIIKEEDEGE